MRNNDPLFFPGSDFSLSLRQQMNKNYSDCINILQTQWYQADLDQRFALGDQDLWGLLYPGVATYRRKVYNFNLINGALQMIGGFQRRNRKSTTCIPVHSPMQKTADQFTKCLYHVHNTSGAYQVYSDAFEQGALTQGIGFLSVYQDMTNDPISGDIKVRYIDFKSVLCDPYFRKHDMSDCRFFWTRTFFDKQEAAELYPQFKEEILALPCGTYRDDKFYYMPEVYQIQFPNLIAFDEYWYLSTRTATYIVDTETEEIQEFDGDEEEFRDAIRAQRRANPQFRTGRMKLIEKSRPTVRRSIILNDKVFVDEPNPYGLDCYPYVPVLAYFTPDTPYYAYKFRGIVRDARDAAYLFNRRKVADLDILEAQQQGLKIEKGALVTPDDAFNQGNGRVLVTDTGMFDKVMQMDIHAPSPTMIQMEEMLESVMMKIMGANEELMGSAVDEKAGIVSMLRQGAGLTRLQRVFDQFEEAQRLVGEIMLKIIQKKWTYGKVQQVIGEEPTKEFDNKLFFKYGAKVAPGVLTESQHQLEAQQLLYIKEMGGPIEWSDILPKLTIQNKDELLQKMMQREEAAAQQQQQMAQLQMQQMQVDNQTKISYAHSQEGLAAERLAKIQTDKALNEERISRSQEERTSGALNILKGAKEIENLDTDQIVKSAQVLTTLQQLLRNNVETQIQGGEQSGNPPEAVAPASE